VNKSSIEELIAEVKSSVQSDLLERGGAQFQSVAELAPDRRLAVGYSRHEGEFWLEF
jgi:hypothetical protein